MVSPEVFAVVVSYNGLPATQRAIQGLLGQVEPVRILVWDNNSTDGSAEWLSDNAQELGFECHLSKANLYWTPAINRAIEHHWDGEPYVVYMNNDVYVYPEGIARMKSALAEFPKVGAVGPMGSSFGGQQDWAHANGPVDLYARTPELLERVIRGREPKLVNLLMGAMVVMPKAVYDTVGPLDEDIMLGGDDYDYSLRLQAAGYDLMVCENVYVEHMGHLTGSSDEGKQIWDIIGQRSWEAFGRKYPGTVDWERFYRVAE